jgi:hypothetical protein
MNNEEQILRSQIRKAIKIVQEKRSNKIIQEEKELRGIIRKLINEVSISDETPHPSTAINFLKDLIKVIIPQLEDDYKDLTTSNEQRTSFKAHIVKGIQNILAPERSLELEETIEIVNEQDELNVTIDDVPSMEEPLVDFDEEEKEPKTKEETDLEAFGIEGEDLTGRNAAYKSLKKIEKQIASVYADLGNEKDEETFYDYLITNVKLYFDKFEDDLQPSITPEPTTPEYEREKDMQTEPADSEEIPPEEEEL